MFVSILQRFVFCLLRCAGQPLQSRADQNTRKAESGGQPGGNLPERRVKVAEAGRRHTNQEIWQQLKPGCLTAVWPGVGLGAIPRLLPRGETL